MLYACSGARPLLMIQFLGMCHSNKSEFTVALPVRGHVGAITFQERRVTSTVELDKVS